MEKKVDVESTFGSHICFVCRRPINWYIVVSGEENEDTIKGLDNSYGRAESVVTGSYSNGKDNTMYDLEIITQCSHCKAKNKFDYHIDR